MKFQAITNDRREIDVDWSRVNLYVSRWKPGTALDIEIVRRERKVSDPQRKWYWSTVLPCFLDAYFYDRDEADAVHRHLKILFWNVQPDKHGIYRDKDIPSVFSNEPTVPQEERKAYIDWVIRKAAQSPDNPQYVPDPGE